MIRMPGQSHQGPLPPLTDEQRTLAQELHSHLQMLAGQIGERNVFHHDRLVMAADYIRMAGGVSGLQAVIVEMANAPR